MILVQWEVCRLVFTLPNWTYTLSDKWVVMCEHLRDALTLSRRQKLVTASDSGVRAKCGSDQKSVATLRTTTGS